ncbi:MAG TPA: hypothetical protein VFY93_00785 [Planctomycetota bacterium]|nr:hypothetical protein [Planctomycetota bacterium]
MRRALPFLLVLAAASAAEDSLLAGCLPPDTPVYVEIRTPTGEEMKSLAMAKVFSDPRMRALIERSRGKDSSFSSMKVPIGDAFLAIRSEPLSADDIFLDVSYGDAKGERSFRVRNRAAVAVVDFPAGRLPVDAVAAFQTDGDAKDAVTTIERIAAAASLAARDEEGDIDEELARLVQHGEYAGVSYSWADIGPLRICLAPVGDMIVLTTGEARLRDVLDRRAGRVTDSLATDPRHLQMLASVPGDGTPTTQIAIHVDRGLRKLQATHPQIGMFAQQMLTQVGLRDLESLTTVARVSGEGSRACTSVVFAPAERRGGLGRLFEKGGPPPSFGGLAYAPQDAIYVTCGNVDVPGLHRTAMDLGGFQLAMALAVPLERDFGLKLKEDLCDLLGPEMTFLVAPNHGLIPDLALVCESKDPARLERNLVQLFSRLPWPEGQGLKTFQLRDVTVHAMALGDPRLGNVPLAPTFGVVDGRLVVAPYPLAFQRILAVKRGDRPSIETNREFGKLRQVVPADAQGVSYLDLVRIFELFYDTFVPFAQAMSGGATPAQLYEFPDVETLSQHLFGRVAWRTSDERGLRWESYASVDTSSFTLSALAGASLALYFVRAGHDRHMEVQAAAPVKGAVTTDDGQVCRHHVRTLRARLQHYKKEKGRLPDRIEDVDADWMDPQTFVVPGCDGKRYVYLGPKGEGGILLHGYPNGADGLITVLATDLGAPERISEEELRKRKAAAAGR